ncbi:MAG: hypothetical protein H0T42_29375 [Deltaproteobacteria bacterium]|nr:hypothetical protein [Deltaproteobacteria bacterium]
MRAPDDVRHVIERWLEAEPRCTSTIDLRVIPSEDGYYLIAQRPDGRIHERFVPDAQSAGVLVASWVADDWVVPKSEASIAPPQFTPPILTRGGVTKTVPRVRRSSGPRWLTLGTMVSSDTFDDGGLRAEIDIFTWGRFTIGATFGWTETSTADDMASSYSDIRTNDVETAPYVAYTLRSDGWELRAAAEVGFVPYSHAAGTAGATGTRGSGYFDLTGAGVAATASLLLTRQLGASWGIHAGVHAHWIHTNYVGYTRDENRMFAFTGLRRRL